MRLFLLSVGGLTTAAMLCVSMWVNFSFGFSLGQTPERAVIFGCVSVISDFWKAIGLMCVVVLFRTKQRWAATVAFVIWGACLLYSVTSAVGAAIEDRSNRTGDRQVVTKDYDELDAEAQRLETQRKDLRAHRSASEVEASINTLLMRSVGNYRGSVGELSGNCQRLDQRTNGVCSDIAKLREELAAAKEQGDLDRKIEQLRSQVRELRKTGGIKSSDPQAELLARITGGRLSPHSVGQALALLLAGVIESVSALGPTVLMRCAEATKTRDMTETYTTVRYMEALPIERRVEAPEAPGLVVDYLAEHIEPATDTETVSERALYANYAAWCRASNLAELSPAEFVAEFDQLRAENGLGKIRKGKRSYGGIRLAMKHPRQPNVAATPSVVARRARSRPVAP